MKKILLSAVIVAIAVASFAQDAPKKEKGGFWKKLGNALNTAAQVTGANINNPCSSDYDIQLSGVYGNTQTGALTFVYQVYVKKDYTQLRVRPQVAFDYAGKSYQTVNGYPKMQPVSKGMWVEVVVKDEGSLTVPTSVNSFQKVRCRVEGGGWWCDNVEFSNVTINWVTPETIQSTKSAEEYVR